MAAPPLGRGEARGAGDGVLAETADSDHTAGDRGARHHVIEGLAAAQGDVDLPMGKGGAGTDDGGSKVNPWLLRMVMAQARRSGYWTTVPMTCSAIALVSFGAMSLKQPSDVFGLTSTATQNR